ncbi:MAG: hypothetical protein MUC63_09995 [Planctomycetes bacterium]|nr:hypothetical protein [Planctomycetota bacterium]
MAIVNSLLFDDKRGAILSDEEYWFLRRRKSFFADNLHSLLDDAQAQAWNLEAIWGACGHPAFGAEVVAGIRGKIRDKEEEAKKKGTRKPPFSTLREIGLVGLETVREVVRRRVNEKLRFLYGFEADDLLRGSFEADGKTYEIKQDAVKKAALEILEGGNKGQMYKNIFSNFGILLGWDPEDGIAAFHVNAEIGVLSMVSGRFEAIGTGKYASGMSFADFLGRHTLCTRRKGFDRVEGTYELILSAVVASQSFHEVGGDFHMAVVDGSAKAHADRCRFVDEDRMRLATEAVRGAREGFVAKKAALDAVEAAVYGDDAFERVEDRLFRSAAKPKALELLCRGYKAAELPETAPAAPAGRRGRRK